jgi:hypothetical protein
MKHQAHAPNIEDENLAHVILNQCSDPDCELHNPDVGFEEGTVTKTDLAFFIAGWYAGGAFIADQAGDAIHNIHDELIAEGIIPQPKEGDSFA